MFETETAAQDVVELNVGFNWRPAGSESLADEVDLFAALAEFAVNEAAIEDDLVNLLLPPEKLKPDSPEAKKAKSAVVALSQIARRIASNWSAISPDPPPKPEEARLVPAEQVGFTLQGRTRPDAKGGFAIDALVLTLADPDGEWGPEGMKPSLGYVDDAGQLQPMKLEYSGDDWLEYRPPTDRPPVTAFSRRTFAIAYEGFDALAVQSARAAVAVVRNARLLDRPTDPAFVYRTPEIHFSEVAMPALVDDEAIPIGSGVASGYKAAVSSAFAALLSTAAERKRTRHKLTVRYGYRLTPSEGEEEGIVVMSPLLFRPLFAYDDDVPKTLGEAVAAWLGENPPPPGASALLSLELATFSSVLPERQQPLVELNRLDYALT
jgi:hypothetical protein